MTRRPRQISGFTLLEVVAAIVVLAIVIPPTVTMLASAANARSDAVSLARGAALADAVLEHIIADVASDDASLRIVIASVLAGENPPVEGTVVSTGVAEVEFVAVPASGQSGEVVLEGRSGSARWRLSVIVQ